ncbi:unnamed protein product [Trichogramma brassicae]|uniref:Uncharacterized protein n=1 Tax=Trichogramma brassicae TaxID=86971 RepID=A0A6H5I3G1_9HYME|nr:unnamed protein product [Trichogramma brassicae]
MPGLRPNWNAHARHLLRNSPARICQKRGGSERFDYDTDDADQSLQLTGRRNTRIAVILGAILWCGGGNVHYERPFRYALNLDLGGPT